MKDEKTQSKTAAAIKSSPETDRNKGTVLYLYCNIALLN